MNRSEPPNLRPMHTYKKDSTCSAQATNLPLFLLQQSMKWPDQSAKALWLYDDVVD